MPTVRPLGQMGSLGLLLPTAPQGKFVHHLGTTNGSTARSSLVLGPEEGPADALAGICRDAEAAGAGALWAIDHLFWPRPMLECLTALTVAATSTSHVPLGSCVLQLPLRQPAAVAKQASTIQLLSGGRFVLGVGIGSHRGEFDRAGVDFDGRATAMDAGIDELRSAWAAADDDALVYRQIPHPGDVPIWIGGSSTAARRRAARTGDGWVPLFVSAEQYARDLRLLREETLTAGRDPEAVTASTVVFVHVGPERSALGRGCAWLSSFYGIPPKAFARHLIAGPAEACAEQIVAHLDAGAEHVVTMVADDNAVEHFAELTEACALGRAGRPTWEETWDPWGADDAADDDHAGTVGPVARPELVALAEVGT